jgi:hypothetical protein
MQANTPKKSQDALDSCFQAAMRQGVAGATPPPYVWRRIKRRLDCRGRFDLSSTSLLNSSFFTCQPDFPGIDCLRVQYYFIGYSVRPL